MMITCSFFLSPLVTVSFRGLQVEANGMVYNRCDYRPDPARVVKAEKRSPKPVALPIPQSGSQYSVDGACGSQNRGLLCSATSTVYTGTCCSS